jgi:hypothetical protein
MCLGVQAPGQRKILAVERSADLVAKMFCWGLSALGAGGLTYGPSQRRTPPVAAGSHAELREQAGKCTPVGTTSDDSVAVRAGGSMTRQAPA